MCEITYEKVEVSAYSGFRHVEKPLTITYKNKKQKIKKILERSIEEILPSQDYIYRFRVIVEDNKLYDLQYHVNDDMWFIASLNKVLY